MNNMFYSKIHRLPIYDSHLFQVIISDNIEKINKILKQNRDSYFASCWRHLYGIKNNRCITIVLNIKLKNNIINAGIIAHECVHAKNMLFESIGYKVKINNDEAEAHLVEYLMNYTYNFYNKVNKIENENYSTSI